MKKNNEIWNKQWDEIKEIGRGGQGVVTLLQHKTDLTRRAVLKCIVPRWKDDKQALERLHQEAEVLLKLNELKAQVPTLFDSSLNKEDVEPFILMEFIEGTRFDEWIESSSPVSINESVAITREISKTIELCHGHKIGHRDIKPTNIILKNGDVNSPYILDFGIAFDSKQTYVLTKKGEMFWNEFIILPECQDLEGNQRDLRSDITALAGIFFTCLTGRPPIVLRDAHELAPHQRHEKLILENSETAEQAEHLSWFFDRAFSYRIADRFQNLNEFTSEIARLANTTPKDSLSLFEEFSILDQTIRSTDRTIQLQSLNGQLQKPMSQINQTLKTELNSLKQHNGHLSISIVQINQKLLATNPTLTDAGDILNDNKIYTYSISRPSFALTPMAMIVAFAVDMQIHLYIGSCGATSNKQIPSNVQITWTKLVVLEEDTGSISGQKLTLVTKTIQSKLANETRKITRGLSVKTPS